MAQKIDFTLVSPEQIVLNEQVDMVVIPGENGDFGVLPNHAALISTLRAGLIHVYKQSTVTHQIFISGGFAQVNEQGCTVLSEECVFVDDLQQTNLESQLNDIKMDLELARNEEESLKLQHNLDITSLKLELIKRLSTH